MCNLEIPSGLDGSDYDVRVSYVNMRHPVVSLRSSILLRFRWFSCWQVSLHVLKGTVKPRLLILYGMQYMPGKLVTSKPTAAPGLVTVYESCCLQTLPPERFIVDYCQQEIVAHELLSLSRFP